MNAIRSFNTADGARDPNLLVDEAFKTICLTDAKSFLDCHTNGEAVEGFTSAKTALDRLVNGTIDKAKLLKKPQEMTVIKAKQLICATYLPVL